MYYDKDQQDDTIKLTSPSIFAAIDGITRGSIAPKHSENFAERFSRVHADLISICSHKLTIIYILLQNLNAKLISLESFVANKPLQIAFVVIVVLVLVFLVAKRVLADDATDPMNYRHSKSRRLD